MASKDMTIQEGCTRPWKQTVGAEKGGAPESTGGACQETETESQTGKETEDGEQDKRVRDNEMLETSKESITHNPSHPGEQLDPVAPTAATQERCGFRQVLWRVVD
ncbi:hypothetical protein NDU88_005673 [Pleurodeles waltl]|uniref:Uncharacterized protein n=1 Tax=Pleurodeles waltl TaxID=8319 RepID=A0AAV7SMH6_PLEWA|nr:hypothetical protein NDU88_005673 [Pleurodeles waltl]